jgi:hypothetical protein
MKKDFIEFKLSKSINTSVGSELKDLDTLYLKCFNIADHRNATISLRNQYKRMVIDVLPELEKLPKPKDQEGSGEQKAEDIRELFSIFDGDKFIVFLDKFLEFFKLDILFKDENFKHKANDIDIKKINPDDIELLIAKYIEVFFLSSWMK